MKNLNKKIPISVGVVVIIISAVVIFGGIYFFQSKYRIKEKVTVDQNKVATSTVQAVSSSTINNSSSGFIIESQAKKVVEIYFHKKYSNDEPTVCLNSYLYSGDEYGFDLAKDCSLTKGIDFSNPDFTHKGIVHLLFLSEFINNPNPIVKYLISERASSSSLEYSLIYSDFILSKHLEDSLKNIKNPTYEINSILSERDQDSSDILDEISGNAYIVETMSVKSNIDLAVINDVAGGGAYNITGTIYQVAFSDNNIDVKLAKIVNTTPKKVSVFKQESIPGSIDGNFYNVYFNQKEKSIYSHGFLAWGSFPCNDYDKYVFYNDRLILVSTTEAKGCKNLDIESPSYVPDNFDSTQVEIYKVSPEILEKAKNI